MRQIENIKHDNFRGEKRTFAIHIQIHIQIVLRRSFSPFNDPEINENV